MIVKHVVLPTKEMYLGFLAFHGTAIANKLPLFQFAIKPVVCPVAKRIFFHFGIFEIFLV